VRILDPDTGVEVPVGMVGEVRTRSGFNMLGYWDKPDETARTIDDDGWLRTGDAGYIDEEGYLFLHDRIKDMVVSGGRTSTGRGRERPARRGRRGGRGCHRDPR